MAEEEVGTKGVETRQLDVDRCRRPGHGIRRGRDRTMTRWTGRNTTKSAVCLSMVRCVCDAGAQRFAYRANAVLAAFPGDCEECEEGRGRGGGGGRERRRQADLPWTDRDERGCWAASKRTEADADVQGGAQYVGGERSGEICRQSRVPAVLMLMKRPRSDSESDERGWREVG